jgi:3'-5' exoribonuclease
MVVSHHGQPNFGACKRPQTAEALVLWYIDTIDSKFRVLGEELEKTEAGQFSEGIAVLDKIKVYKAKN